MVKVDWPFIVTACEPESAEEERPGPETAQLFTWEAFQEMVEMLPERRRSGTALIEANGSRTVTFTTFEFAVAPAQMT